VREARKLGVAVIGMCDTDCDPSDVDIVIPGNDDALKSVRLLVEALAVSVEQGSSNHRERMATTESAQRSTEAGQAYPDDEPRPTRVRKLPTVRSEGEADGKPEAPGAPAPKSEAAKDEDAGDASDDAGARDAEPKAAAAPRTAATPSERGAS
jgi:small subunit ribosomal protein S2